MSKSYTVIRKRAYWVREVMHVDATDEIQAEDVFYNEFDAVELIVEEVCTFGNEQLCEPLEVIENE
jgi:hypothetical protein